MNCPNCGSASPSGQNFCRSCGTNLQTGDGVGRLDAARTKLAASGADLLEMAIRGTRRRRHRRTMVILTPVIILGILVLLGFEPSESAVPIALIIGVVLARYIGRLEWRFKGGSDRTTVPLTAQSPMIQMPSYSQESVPSVTESTTRIFEPIGAALKNGTQQR